ncbi:MAG: V-type ATP synthase subunit E family protein [Planctomycetota bacterium]|jgi:V/A-type H+-transporting ATPase subunit E
MTESDADTSGVKVLIDRIRDEGVQSARDEADRIISEAKAQAARIVSEAKAEAASVKKEAHAAMEREQTATIEALRIAARDTGLELRSAIMSAFEEHVRRLVTDVTTDGSVLRDMILVLAGRAAGDFIKDKDAVILIPSRLSDEVSAELEEFLKQSSVAFSADVLRQGVELIPSNEIQGGARVRLVGEDLEIDLSDEALSEMMLKMLLPRYRRILVEAGQ